MSATWEIREGDALERLREMPDESVQCCVTSPPYFGLRDYGTGEWEGGEDGCDHLAPAPGGHAASGLGNYDNGLNAGTIADKITQRRQQFRDECGKCGARRVDRQIGLESTPDQFVARLVEVFREVRRVLRSDGTLWLNIGDSYCSTDKWGGGKSGNSGKHTVNGNDVPSWAVRERSAPIAGVKPKDLLMVPAMLALALRADGWWLRSDIILAKKNPMPESVADRPTSAHEHMFLFSKRPTYFYDSDAIREADSGHPSGNGFAGRQDHRLSGGLAVGGTVEQWQPGTGRNKRNWWPVDEELWSQFVRWLDEQVAERPDVWEVVSEPFPGAHFAVFGTKWIEPCILAGSSPKACGECGAPWERVVERQAAERIAPQAAQMAREEHFRETRPVGQRGNAGMPRGQTMAASRSSRTLGWQPSCAHVPDDTGHSVILDPFAGAGTTGLVALRHDRSFIGIELSPAYAEMARERIRGDMPLFNWQSEASAAQA